MAATGHELMDPVPYASNHECMEIPMQMLMNINMATALEPVTNMEDRRRRDSRSLAAELQPWQLAATTW